MYTRRFSGYHSVQVQLLTSQLWPSAAMSARLIVKANLLSWVLKSDVHSVLSTHKYLAL